MIAFLSWYLSVSAIGWLAFPIVHHLFPALPDRGYNLSRAFGLLVWGYLFWLLASLGMLQNDAAGLLTALLLVLALTLWAGWNGRFRAIWAWLKQHRKLVITSEVVFLVAFGLWTWIRALNPEIYGTEKPMEMAFINAILRSPTFPPHDPWLSGYAISYYYFGYVLVAMLIKFTSIPSAVGFNLAAASWFALTAAGCFSILFNLLQGLRLKRNSEATAGQSAEVPEKQEGRHLLASLFGPIFVLLVSNLDGILEVLHARGIFWQQAPNGQWTSTFWSWLDIQELNQPPALPLTWMPNRPGGILWWRASRVLQDFTLDHQPREIIDEFPFFSYLLSDLHPHVLVMPFALLAIGLALNVFYRGAEGQVSLGGWFRIPIRLETFLSGALILGGLAFLNTWDFPIYVLLFCSAYALLQYKKEGWSWRWVGEFVILGIAVGVVGAVLYLPFYVGFASQAGGIIPSMIFFTRGVYFWVMFATLLIPIGLLLLYLWRRGGHSLDLKFGLFVASGLILGLLIFSYGLGIVASFIPGMGDLFLSVQGATQAGIGALVKDSLIQRLLAPGTWLTLGVILFLIAALLKAQWKEKPEGAEITVAGEKPDSIGFVLLLIFLGSLLTLIPEFIYLRDQFGYRINTIFKFYFQTWMVWGLAAAFSAAFLLIVLKGWWSRLFQVGLVLLLAIGLLYPAFSLWDKTDHFAPPGGLTLDGTATLNPDELAAVQWLRSQPEGVVVEAINQASSYTDYSRISEYSGDPTIIGWTGHESQWRGNSLPVNEIGNRVVDVETLYRTTDWQQALQIIKKYNVRYIYVGALERSDYRVNDALFKSHLETVFTQGSVVIYQVSSSLTAQTSGNGLP